VRWVVSCNAVYASSSFDGEWYVGIGNPDGSGNMNGGALLSFAPGFSATGLLAGSYTSISSRTYTHTPFTIARNTWYDFIISWTPTAIKYYAAVYGSTPKLIATITTDISTIAQYPLAGNNRYCGGTHSVTLSIDKVEWLYQTSGKKSLTKSSVPPRKFSTTYFRHNRCTISLQPQDSRLKSMLSFVTGTLCPSTGLIPVFSEPTEATASKPDSAPQTLSSSTSSSPRMARID